MLSTTELSDARRALDQLRSTMGALRTRYGDVGAVRRIGNDLERLEIDLNELAQETPAPRRQPASETVLVPDTPYDPELWRDADDEGVGGIQPRR